jgi:hypothetical protein
MPRTHCRSPAVPLARLLAMNGFECRGGKRSKISPRGALNLPFENLVDFIEVRVARGPAQREGCACFLDGHCMNVWW